MLGRIGGSVLLSLALCSSASAEGCGGYEQTCNTITPRDVYDMSVPRQAGRLGLSCLFGAAMGALIQFNYIARFWGRRGYRWVRGWPQRAEFLDHAVSSSQPANDGLTTHVLVAVAACIYTLSATQGVLAVQVPYSTSRWQLAVINMERITASVVRGVGFLGAGAILRDSGSGSGLCEAAAIWCTAALGVTAASFDPEALWVCVLALGIIGFMVTVAAEIESWMHSRQSGHKYRPVQLSLCFESEEDRLAAELYAVLDLIEQRIGPVQACQTHLDTIGGSARRQVELAMLVGRRPDAAVPKALAALAGLLGPGFKSGYCSNWLSEARAKLLSRSGERFASDHEPITPRSVETIETPRWRGESQISWASSVALPPLKLE